MDSNSTKNPPTKCFAEQPKDTKNQGDQQPTTRLTLADLDANFEQLENQLDEQSNTIGVFKIQSANQWLTEASKRPIPKMLFDHFWYQGELCILFADTNLGKSILAVQIGDAISRGNAIQGFQLEAAAQLVVYFDFELSDKQFENRYSIDYRDHYQFAEQFQRVELNPLMDSENSESFEQHLYQSLVHLLERTAAKVLIIDNLTYLKDETEKAKTIYKAARCSSIFVIAALPLGKALKGVEYVTWNKSKSATASMYTIPTM